MSISDTIKAKREEIGFNYKAAAQIKKTMNFEMKKNKMKFITLTVVVGLLYLLSQLLVKLQLDRGMPMPDTPANYFSSYLTLIDMIILIIAATYAGSIIVEDFEKQNLTNKGE